MTNNSKFYKGDYTVRILEYKLELEANGYTVTSGYRHYEYLSGYESECLPIVMTVQECYDAEYGSDLSKMVAHDCWDEEDAKKDFYQHYEEIFWGKCKDWILIQFQVHAGYILLDFYNPETGETGFLNLCKTPRMELQFDVPRRDGGSVSRYLVKVSARDGHLRTDVTEHTNDVRRELVFIEHGERQPPNKPRHISVTEYADM